MHIICTGCCNSCRCGDTGISAFSKGIILGNLNNWSNVWGNLNWKWFVRTTSRDVMTLLLLLSPNAIVVCTVHVSHKMPFFVQAYWDYDGRGNRLDNQMVANDQVGFVCFANCLQDAEGRTVSGCECIQYSLSFLPRTSLQVRNAQVPCEHHRGL